MLPAGMEQQSSGRRLNVLWKMDYLYYNGRIFIHIDNVLYRNIVIYYDEKINYDACKSNFDLSPEQRLNHEENAKLCFLLLSSQIILSNYRQQQSIFIVIREVEKKLFSYWVNY